MSEIEQNIEQEDVNKQEDTEQANCEAVPEIEDVASENAEIVALQEKMAEAQDKYLRLYAEFDNYRKRTLKERYELVKTAGEDVIQGFLSIIDDFDRAVSVMDKANDVEAVREGVLLIYNKLIGYLKQKGLTEIDAQGKEFDTDHHEAVAKFAVNESDKKGKVIDVVQKGYMLNDKVIRYAKVVVGE